MRWLELNVYNFKGSNIYRPRYISDCFLEATSWNGMEFLIVIQKQILLVK